jgi:hypothetical protein
MNPQILNTVLSVAIVVLAIVAVFKKGVIIHNEVKMPNIYNYREETELDDDED